MHSFFFPLVYICPCNHFSHHFCFFYFEGGVREKFRDLMLFANRRWFYVVIMEICYSFCNTCLLFFLIHINCIFYCFSNAFLLVLFFLGRLLTFCNLYKRVSCICWHTQYVIYHKECWKYLTL